MILPNIGELNTRARLFSVKTIPEGDYELSNERTQIAEVWAKIEIIGGSQYLESVNTEESVTHRIYVRYVKGFTSPLDLQHITEVDLGGFTYMVKRVTDVNSAGRFTLLECEQMKSVEEVPL